jgi:shikimate dehydrogenase
MSQPITGATKVAGVVGRPVAHSLSPVLHNAWLAAAGIDGVYVPLSVEPDAFAGFIEGLRGGSIAGLNVTLPFKAAALAAADNAHHRAVRAHAANVLTFKDGRIWADNTDGLGLLAAFAAQAPGFDPAAGPVVILGAGGGAHGAAGAFVDAGCREVRIVNRTLARAEGLAGELGAKAFALAHAEAAFKGAAAVINATSAGLADATPLDLPLEATPKDCVVMDMTYKPLITPVLAKAQALGRPIVDGLEMLIGQAIPSFTAFFGRPPPAGAHVRALALAALEAAA